jgi:hypothetical protein
MEVFVVRIWPETPTLRGLVEHVGSGTTDAFQGSDALLAFLGSHLVDGSESGTSFHDTLMAPETGPGY